MKTLVFVLTLMLASAVVGQPPRSQNDPQSSPPQQTTPSQQMPPDQQAAPPSGSTSSQVQQQIQQSWQSQSDLSGSKLNAQVSGGTVTLSGTVATEELHQKAVQAATQSANGMKIVDKIKVQPK